jgi:hypothetical protein
MLKARRLRYAAPLSAVLLAVALATPAMALQVGDKAPDFTLPSSQVNAQGQPVPVKLSDLTAKGPVVIYTFIAAFTGT